MGDSAVSHQPQAGQCRRRDDPPRQPWLEHAFASEGSTIGLHNFIASAGRILGAGGGKAQAAEVQHEGSPTPGPPLAEAVRDQVRNAAPNADLRVRVEGDTVHLEGSVSDPEARERAIVAAGNIAGVGRVNDDGIAGPSAERPEFYTVRRGDTLSAIAKRHYGNANAYMAIFEANRPMLDHPDRIYPGQVLLIPRPGRSGGRR